MDKLRNNKQNNTNSHKTFFAVILCSKIQAIINNITAGIIQIHMTILLWCFLEVSILILHISYALTCFHTPLYCLRIIQNLPILVYPSFVLLSIVVLTLYYTIVNTSLNVPLFSFVLLTNHCKSYCSVLKYAVEDKRSTR